MGHSQSSLYMESQLLLTLARMEDKLEDIDRRLKRLAQEVEKITKDQGLNQSSNRPSV
jgi:archaellum component FlaC